jgi:hypothetical protein
MRFRIVVNGIPAWSENQPANGTAGNRSSSVRGELVTAPPAPPRTPEFSEVKNARQRAYYARTVVGGKPPRTDRNETPTIEVTSQPIAEVSPVSMP